MKLSSFIMITAAGLAVAAPIHPYSADDMSLTVEPAEVVKRQDNNLEPLNTVTSATKALPVVGKRGRLIDMDKFGLLVARGKDSSDKRSVLSMNHFFLPIGKRESDSSDKRSVLSMNHFFLPIGKRAQAAESAQGTRLLCKASGSQVCNQNS
jgi:hypothetical protein